MGLHSQLCDTAEPTDIADNRPEGYHVRSADWASSICEGKTVPEEPRPGSSLPLSESLCTVIGHVGL